MPFHSIARILWLSSVAYLQHGGFVGDILLSVLLSSFHDTPSLHFSRIMFDHALQQFLLNVFVLVEHFPGQLHRLGSDELEPEIVSGFRRSNSTIRKSLARNSPEEHASTLRVNVKPYNCNKGLRRSNTLLIYSLHVAVYPE